MSGYPQSLKYFMWPYQVYYKISCQSKSENLFNHFDRGLIPTFFMLGIRSDSNQNFPDICFEPENMDFLKPEFSSLENKAVEVKVADPYKNLLYSGTGVQEEMDTRREADYKRKAIEGILNSIEDKKDEIYFVSEASEIGSYYVYGILSLQRDIYMSHLHLSHDLYDERFKIHRSIIEVAIDQYLHDCKINLYFPNPGKNLGSEYKGYQELLRESARQFMYTITSKGKRFEGIHTFFTNCDTISTFKYEGQEALGRLIIASTTNINLDYLVRLSQPFKLSDIRKTRKLLQLTSDTVGVITDSYLIYGLGSVSNSYDPKNEDIFSILFTGTNCWEVWHSNDHLVSMRFGLPYFLSEIIDRKKFASDCERIFSGITKTQTQNLYLLAVAATSQRSGALLVISDGAEAEAQRLSQQCIPIEPLQVEAEMLINLTSIDGGLLIDRTGKAYAQGVILDGIVGKNGDAARGSRYNSAVTYYEYKGSEIPTIIIVVSEDGMVDVLPNLRPQIKRSDINNLILYLESLQESFDRKLFNEIMFSLKSKEFYLSAEQCEKINFLNDKFSKERFEGLSIIHPKVYPNEDMDDSYYLPE